MHVYEHLDHWEHTYISNADNFSEHEGLNCQPIVLMLLQNADLLCMYMLIKISSLVVTVSHYDNIIVAIAI